jgi:hypothetical protein
MNLAKRSHEFRISGMSKKVLFFFFSIIYAATLFAGHYRAGEITYKFISGLTYEIKITTYSDIIDTNGVHQIIIYYGDGTNDTILRTGKTLISTYESVQNIYTCHHTYAGQGSYIISFADTFRTIGVVNIPNSANVGFCIESLININPFLGANNSPDFLSIPLDQAFAYNPFLYNSIANDVDGDSLSYKLMTCRNENCADIAGYTSPPTSNTYALNPITGDLLWDSPMALGDYNIAMLIEEWRMGMEIGYVLRDIQIHVKGGSGVENYFSNEKINIFPNPATNNLTIETTEKASIEILNIQGQILKTITTAEKQTNIDVSDLSSGVYIIKAKTEKGVVVKKFVKE